MSIFNKLVLISQEFSQLSSVYFIVFLLFTIFLSSDLVSKCAADDKSISFIRKFAKSVTVWNLQQIHFDLSYKKENAVIKYSTLVCEDTHRHTLKANSINTVINISSFFPMCYRIQLSQVVCNISTFTLCLSKLHASNNFIQSISKSCNFILASWHNYNLNYNSPTIFGRNNDKYLNMRQFDTVESISRSHRA